MRLFLLCLFSLTICAPAQGLPPFREGKIGIAPSIFGFAFFGTEEAAGSNFTELSTTYNFDWTGSQPIASRVGGSRVGGSTDLQDNTTATATVFLEIDAYSTGRFGSATDGVMARCQFFDILYIRQSNGDRPTAPYSIVIGFQELEQATRNDLDQQVDEALDRVTRAQSEVFITLEDDRRSFGTWVRHYRAIQDFDTGASSVILDSQAVNNTLSRTMRAEEEVFLGWNATVRALIDEPVVNLNRTGQGPKEQFIARLEVTSKLKVWLERIESSTGEDLVLESSELGLDYRKEANDEEFRPFHLNDDSITVGEKQTQPNHTYSVLRGSNLNELAVDPNVDTLRSDGGPISFNLSRDPALSREFFRMQSTPPAEE